jgi:hypothetical protein
MYGSPIVVKTNENEIILTTQTNYANEDFNGYIHKESKIKLQRTK